MTASDDEQPMTATFEMDDDDPVECYKCGEETKHGDVAMAMTDTEQNNNGAVTARYQLFICSTECAQEILRETQQMMSEMDNPHE